MQDVRVRDWAALSVLLRYSIPANSSLAFFLQPVVSPLQNPKTKPFLLSVPRYLHLFTPEQHLSFSVYLYHSN